MIKIAWRNLWRRRSRTLITVSTISLSLAMAIFSLAVSSSAYSRMLASALEQAGGSILIHGDGYWETRAGDKVVADYSDIRTKVAAVPEVTAVLPRIMVNALVASPRGNRGVQITAIAPEAEAELKDLSRYLTRGTFLDSPRALALGAELADELELELGDRVVMTATDPAGEMTRALLRLRGILESGSKAFDASAAYTQLSTLQDALNMKHAVTQLGVLIDNDEKRAQVATEIKATLGPGAEDLEVLTWSEAHSQLLNLIEMDRNYAYVMGLVIFLVVGFGVANTLLMSVLERVRELGLLAALGLKPSRLSGLVLVETLLLCAVASGIGLGIATGMHWYVASVGIDAAALSGGESLDMAGVAFEDSRIRSKFVFWEWAGSVIAITLVVLLSALYPARRASKLAPAEAMRSYE